MPQLTLKPTHKCVVAYYENLARFEKLGIKYESAVRSAFQELLETCARQFDWKLVPEYPIKRKGKAAAKADGALLDPFGLNHGLWEAKDQADDLEKEIKLKFAAGYPKDNILFQEPCSAILYQQGECVYRADLTKPEDLVHVLQLFLEYAPPAIAEWEKAIGEFRDRIPQIGASLKALIEKERQTNKKFIAAFEDFCSLCRGSLNPNISVEAVEEMIIQHILTERIFRKIFDVADFISRNVIAQEIEKVITALNSRVFSRDDFSKSMEHFYGAIENAAATITDFTEKQTFLNTVYERFFQGFCVKVADTHGIVYTPQPLVNFMVASVEHILKVEFGKSLADKDVHILDPFTGTGNFIVNLMRNIPPSALPHKFRHELHCNEVMLLPYYVASMNIEHAYYEATGKYEPFEGVCLVDTFQTMEKQQAELSFFNEKNSARVDRQKKSPIRVVIGNPPYNAWQMDENDNNKNRKYPELDRRIRVTYSDDSTASLKNSLSDPYIKAIRWAADRIGESGVVCLVTNNGFIDGIACDGMRKHLGQDFDEIYLLNLGGNVRKNPKLSGTTHNVFGIQLGVSINLFVRQPKAKDVKRHARIRYHAVVGDWRKEEKFHFLDKTACVSGVKWTKLSPDAKGNWLTNPTDYEFGEFLPVGIRDEKGTANPTSIFSTYCRGITSSRDEWVFSFNQKHLAEKVEKLIENYNSEVARFRKRAKREIVADSFVRNDPSFVKWTDRLKHALTDGKELDFEAKLIRNVLYRPFTKMSVYFDDLLIHRRYLQPRFFPTASAEVQNRAIALTDVGSGKPFMLLATNRIADLHIVGGGASSQCFPLFTYSGDGKERRDNITSKALTLFQIFYDDDAIKREDIFNYVYALLHHPTYRTRFAENLKRELPRIPFIGVAADVSPRQSHSGKGAKKSAPTDVGDYAKFFPLSSIEKMQGDAKPDHDPKASAKLFHTFAAAGKKLADLHVNYESAKEFPLKRIENKEVPLDWRVESMKLLKVGTRSTASQISPTKKGKVTDAVEVVPTASIIYNDFLTLTGIPPEAFDYRLGNRSALEWVIDQYRVTRDEHAKITSDPNRMDDEEYIVRLIGQVITVSLETQQIIDGLPPVKSLTASASGRNAVE